MSPISVEELAERTHSAVMELLEAHTDFKAKEVCRTARSVVSAIEEDIVWDRKVSDETIILVREAIGEAVPIIKELVAENQLEKYVLDYLVERQDRMQHLDKQDIIERLAAL